SLSEGAITTIRDDGNGNLWMILSNLDGKTTYINKFEKKNHRFKHFGIHETGNGYIYASECLSLCEGRRDQMWIGTNNGLYEYSPDRDTFSPHFTTNDSSQQKRFNQLTNDAVYPGIIWMTVFETKSQRGTGLWRYNTNDNSMTTYSHIDGRSASLGCDSVFSIQKDSHGRLWFGTFIGLSTYSPATKDFVNYTINEKQQNPWYNAIFILAEDKAGNFWCGNQNNLLLFDTTTREFTRYRPNEKDPDALHDDGYTNVLIDRSGTLWVGTAFQGLNWLNIKRSRFSVYKNNPGQSHYFPGGGICSFAEDKDETFWVWSSQGLFHWYPSSDSFAVIKSMVRKRENFPWRFGSVVADKQGAVWCSTFGDGLYRYDPKNGEFKNF
ncbi:MAG: ligand-binding sensor domain-containing protein, partial [Ginsengibacter sp.]